MLVTGTIAIDTVKGVRSVAVPGCCAKDRLSGLEVPEEELTGAAVWVEVSSSSSELQPAKAIRVPRARIRRAEFVIRASCAW